MVVQCDAQAELWLGKSRCDSLLVNDLLESCCASSSQRVSCACGRHDCGRRHAGLDGVSDDAFDTTFARVLAVLSVHMWACERAVGEYEVHQQQHLGCGHVQVTLRRSREPLALT